MLAWLHAHHASGIYWVFQHVVPAPAAPPGPVLLGQGAFAGGSAGMNGFGLPLTMPTYAGPPEPGLRPYQLVDYPDALAAFRQGVSAARLAAPAAEQGVQVVG
jgi:hypothetical protein